MSNICVDVDSDVNDVPEEEFFGAIEIPERKDQVSVPKKIASSLEFRENGPVKKGATTFSKIVNNTRHSALRLSAQGIVLLC